MSGVDIDEDEIQPDRLKVNELKTLLNERGLDTKGVKGVLVQRLKEALEEENQNVSEDVVGELASPSVDNQCQEKMKIEVVESVKDIGECNLPKDKDVPEGDTDPVLEIKAVESIDDPIKDNLTGLVLLEKNISETGVQAQATVKPEVMIQMTAQSDVEAIVTNNKVQDNDMKDTIHEVEIDLNAAPQEISNKLESKEQDTLEPKTTELDKKEPTLVDKVTSESEEMEVVKKGHDDDVADAIQNVETQVSSSEVIDASKGSKLSTETVKDTTVKFESKVSNKEKEDDENEVNPTTIQDVKLDVLDDIISTMDSITEVMDKTNKEELQSEEAERDLSSVEPNRDLDEIVIADEVVIKNPDDVQSMEKLSNKLEKLKVIVMELSNYFPDFQPRSKEKLLLNLPFRDKKVLEGQEIQEFKTALNKLRFSPTVVCKDPNCGIGNLGELLASISTAHSVGDKLYKLGRNVTDLSDQLVDYAGHLKRKKARKERETSKESDEGEGRETIGKANAPIYRRKGDFPIIGVSERDISPIRENFDIKKVIGKEKESKGRSRSATRDRGERSKSDHGFTPHVKAIILCIDQLRKNMIIGLTKDDNFKLEKDWEFFTNMFKKQALSWTTAEKLEHLNGLDVEDHVAKKLGDPIWRFLDAKHMTDDRINRIKKYNLQIENKFGIKHEPVVFTEEEKVATRKLKKTLFSLLSFNKKLSVPVTIIDLLDLMPAFLVAGEKGELKEDMQQDTLDFLENEDLLPEKPEDDKFLRTLDHAFLSLVADIFTLPEERKEELGPEILDNLEMQKLLHEFIENARILKELMKEAFEKDDRYCATGDEKYYLDLPGKESEKVLMSEVRRFCRDFDSNQLTKTLTLKFERFSKDNDTESIASFNTKLKTCVQNLGEKVTAMPEADKKRKRSLERDLKEAKRPRDGSRRSRSPIARRGRDQLERKRGRSPDKRRGGRSRSPVGRRRPSRFEPAITSRPAPFIAAPVVQSGMNQDVIAAATNMIQNLNPMAVLQMIGMNPGGVSGMAASGNMGGMGGNIGGNMGGNMAGRNMGGGLPIGRSMNQSMMGMGGAMNQNMSMGRSQNHGSGGGLNHNMGGVLNQDMGGGLNNGMGGGLNRGMGMGGSVGQPANMVHESTKPLAQFGRNIGEGRREEGRGGRGEIWGDGVKGGHERRGEGRMEGGGERRDAGFHQDGSGSSSLR